MKRQARYEWELDHEVLQAVFLAKNMSHMKALIEKNVYGDTRYDKMPKYRQIALEAYFRGVTDAVAKLAGVNAPHISVEKPKARPSARPKRMSKPAPPVMHESPRAPTSEPPPWARSYPPPSMMPEGVAHAHVGG